jgi:hypothetical protein
MTTTVVTILIVEEADRVGSVTEVAVTVTLLPVGAITGAVYVADVAVILLNVPQAPAPLLPHVTDQVTPAFLESLVTVAVSAAVALVASKAGAPESATEMAVIVIVDDADFVGSVTDVAVTVTVLPVGTAEGAV